VKQIVQKRIVKNRQGTVPHNSCLCSTIWTRHKICCFLLKTHQSQDQWVIIIKAKSRPP